MGDRTYVSLHVPNEHAARVSEIAGKEYTKPEDENELDELTFYGFTEVNYGVLPFLKTLQQEGIAYDSEWNAGGEYGKGTEHCRFSEKGELEIKMVYDENLGVSLPALLEAIDDHEALKTIIRNHQAKTVPRSWDNQVQYGKRHRARRLIDPTLTPSPTT